MSEFNDIIEAAHEMAGESGLLMRHTEFPQSGGMAFEIYRVRPSIEDATKLIVEVRLWFGCYPVMPGRVMFKWTSYPGNEKPRSSGHTSSQSNALKDAREALRQVAA